MTEVITHLAAIHGAAAIGLTSYPALEAKLTLTHEKTPDHAAEIVLQAPIARAEPLNVRLSAYVTVWRF